LRGLSPLPAGARDIAKAFSLELLSGGGAVRFAGALFERNRIRLAAALSPLRFHLRPETSVESEASHFVLLPHLGRCLRNFARAAGIPADQFRPGNPRGLYAGCPDVASSGRLWTAHALAS